MLLIVLSIVAVALVALNCFYNVGGLLCYVWSGSSNRYIKDDSSKLCLRRYEDENYVFEDSDFDK